MGHKHSAAASGAEVWVRPTAGLTSDPAEPAARGRGSFSGEPGAPAPSFLGLQRRCSAELVLKGHDTTLGVRRGEPITQTGLKGSGSSNILPSNGGVSSARAHCQGCLLCEHCHSWNTLSSQLITPLWGSSSWELCSLQLSKPPLPNLKME